MPVVTVGWLDVVSGWGGTEAVVTALLATGVGGAGGVIVSLPIVEQGLSRVENIVTVSKIVPKTVTLVWKVVTVLETVIVVWKLVTVSVLVTVTTEPVNEPTQLETPEV